MSLSQYIVPQTLLSLDPPSKKISSVTYYTEDDEKELASELQEAEAQVHRFPLFLT